MGSVTGGMIERSEARENGWLCFAGSLSFGLGYDVGAHERR